MSESGSIIHIKSRNFSIRIVKMHSYIKKKKAPATICDQILRSGTSIAANLAEATFGLTKRDFLHKVSIALKECNETNQWIDLLHRTGYISLVQYESIKADCDELCKIMTKIIITTRKNMGLDNSSDAHTS